METKRDSSERSVEDRFRQAARDSRTLFCAWLSINSPLLIEAIGVAGWDCILIDQRHGLGGHDAMIGCLTAAKAAGQPALVRIANNDPGLIGRALDAGAQGIVCPLINSAEDAERFARAVKGSDFTLILVIGESARADHFSLNGYHRDTNAYTKNEAGLVNFSDVLSCDSLTRVAVPCLLTRATLENKDMSTSETSLLVLAKKHGFHTTWISMNDVFKKNDLPTSVIADSADDKIFRFGVSWNESNDLYLLPHFERVVRAHKGGRQLIVVHLRGSHWRYAERYSADFSVFKPDTDCGRKGSTRLSWSNDIHCIINAYDNSILLTDYILSRFIEDVKDREALRFYVADHGESLGETDQRGQVYWKHGRNERIEQRMVPMQVWASDLFIAKHSVKFAALAHHKSARLSHDHLFHSVLDCVGIESSVVDRRLSLCNQGNIVEREQFLPMDQVAMTPHPKKPSTASAPKAPGLVGWHPIGDDDAHLEHQGVPANFQLQAPAL